MTMEMTIDDLRGSGDFSAAEQARAARNSLLYCPGGNRLPVSHQPTVAGVGLTLARLALAQARLVVLRGQSWDAALAQYHRTIHATGYSDEELDISVRDCVDAINELL